VNSSVDNEVVPLTVYAAILGKSIDDVKIYTEKEKPSAHKAKVNN